MNNNFDKDLPLGKNGEFKVMGYLVDQGWQLVEWRDDSKYDLLMYHKNRNIRSTFEVKTDFYDNGNLVVEYESRGKPSGIAVTEADYWVFYFNETREFWFIDTEDLKELCRDARRIEGGDENSSRMFLLPKFDVRNKFRIREEEIND